MVAARIKSSRTKRRSATQKQKQADYLSVILGGSQVGITVNENGEELKVKITRPFSKPEATKFHGV